MNMSYCRFHNTRIDLADCLDAISQGDTISHEERVHGEKMFRSFLEFCRYFGIISDYRDEELTELFDDCEEDEEEDEEEEDD